MNYCDNCGYEFSTPEKVYENHGFSSPPFELQLVCPNCNSTSFHEKITTHCRCCGAKLSQNKKEYCSNTCREKGRILRNKEIAKNNYLRRSPINEIIRALIIYNKENNTNYSYGQYVALTEQMNKVKNKCASKKKKNI